LKLSRIREVDSVILAALGDVAGNFAALEAALVDIEDAGILTVVQTGNVVGEVGGDAALRSLRERGVVLVQGLHDRQVARARRPSRRTLLLRKLGEETFETLQRLHDSLPRDTVEFLARLPHMHTMTVDGFGIVVCHGSISRVTDRIDATTPLERLRRQREMAPADVIVCGGSPAPFSRLVDGTLFVGPGPLCGAVGDDDACYTVIDLDSEPRRAFTRSVPIPAIGR